MPAAKIHSQPALTLMSFSSRLGWVAMAMVGSTVRRLTFGHPSRAAAERDLGLGRTKRAVAGQPEATLVRRLQAYAAGRPDDFRDVPIDAGPLSVFQSRILEQCRQIPFGQTRSYAELAAKAGSPRAARAVGNCMAGNCIPLIVPCHRVICSDGRLGSYSSPGGAETKRRLLAMEAGN